MLMANGCERNFLGRFLSVFVVYCRARKKLLRQKKKILRSVSVKEQFVIEVNPRLEGYLDEAETYIESGQGAPRLNHYNNSEPQTLEIQEKFSRKQI